MTDYEVTQKLKLLPDRESSRIVKRYEHEGVQWAHFLEHYTGSLGESSNKIEDFFEEIRERLDLWSKGIYTIEDTAQVLADMLESDGDNEWEVGGRVQILYSKIENAIRSGALILREKGIPVDVASLQGSRIRYWRRLRADDVNAWLKAVDARYELKHPYSDSKQESDAQERPAQLGTVPVQRSVAQGTAILEKLTALGYTATSLPNRQSGTAGTKATVKLALGTQGIWSGSTVFDKAWGRLRADGRIAEVKPS